MRTAPQQSAHLLQNLLGQANLASLQAEMESTYQKIRNRPLSVSLAYDCRQSTRRVFAYLGNLESRLGRQAVAVRRLRHTNRTQAMKTQAQFRPFLTRRQSVVAGSDTNGPTEC